MHWELAAQIAAKRKADTAMATFTHRPIDITSLATPHLQQEVFAHAGSAIEAYAIKIHGMDEEAEALYFPAIHRLGIAWTWGDPWTTWATIDDIESGIYLWLNDSEEWEAHH